MTHRRVVLLPLSFPRRTKNRADTTKENTLVTIKVKTVK
jgi:hypothetical protein